MCGRIFKPVVYLINAILLLCGLGGAIFGALLHFQTEIILPYLNSSLSQVTNFVDVSGVQNTIAQLLVYAAPLSYGLMGVGAFLIILGGIAFAGLYCFSNIFLTIYIILVAALALAQIFIGGAYLGQPAILQSIIDKMLKELIQNYVGFNDTSPSSVLLNAIQIYVECCGANNSSDYSNFTETYKDTTTNYPVSCCKINNSTMEPIENGGCPGSFSETNSNMNTGCTEALLPYLKENGGSTIAVGLLFVACIELIVVILTTLYLVRFV